MSNPNPRPVSGAELPIEETEVLICDDEPQVGSLLTDLLSGEGYRTTAVRRGWDAIGRLTERDIHVAIVDKNLPDISGLEVIRLGLQANPDTVFLIVTAYSSFDSAIEAMDLGASAYVSKPFDLPGLLERVDLARQRASRNRLVQRTIVEQRERAEPAEPPSAGIDSMLARESSAGGSPPPDRLRAAITSLRKIREGLGSGRMPGPDAALAIDQELSALESLLGELDMEAAAKKGT